jgi:hypothetical protein
VRLSNKKRTTSWARSSQGIRSSWSPFTSSDPLIEAKMDADPEDIKEANDQVSCPPTPSIDVSDLLAVCGCRFLACTWTLAPPHWVLSEMAMWPADG